MRPTLLLMLTMVGCDPGKGSNVGAGDVDGSVDGDDAGEPGDGADGGGDGADGDGGGGADPLVLTLDRPAFYAVGADPLVTGVARPVERVATLTVSGASVVVGADGSFSAPVALGGVPFDVARVLATDLDGATRQVIAQVAEAEAVATDLADGMRAEIGRAGGDALAASVGAFAQVPDFEPAAGRVLAERTCAPCPLGIECADITETVRLTGAAAVSLAATLDPSTGRLDLDVAGSIVAWGVEVTQEGAGGASFTGDLVATVGGVAGAGDPLSCAGLGLDVAIDAASPTWSLAPEADCIDAVTLGAGSGLWESHAQPGIAAAACRWAPWLDAAVESENDGAAVTLGAAGDPDGLHLSWDAALDGSAPAWRAPDRASPLSPDGVDAALLDPLLGVALDAAVQARLPLEVTAETGEGEARVRLTGLHPDGSSLAAVTPSGGTALLAPMAYTLELDGVACEAAHLVPAVAPLVVAGAGASATFTVPASSSAGADAVPACGLAPATHAALLDAALGAVTDGLTVEWRALSGLVDGGWSATWSPAAAAHTVRVSD
jgi:hypothetical protein